MTCPQYARFPVADRMGIVLGCYGWPRLVELQIRLIRETCGAVPILVCDDASPQAGDIQAVCQQHEVDFQNNSERLGHYAGDLSVFRRGIAWGLASGLQAVVKLSQRMLWTKPKWMLDVVPLLNEFETVCSPCLEPRGRRVINLHCRTECIAMRLDAWGAAPVFDMLNGERLDNATELRINHIIATAFGGRRADWPGMTANRTQRIEGAVWHCCDDVAAYAQLSARFGIDLDAGFSCAGRDRLPGWLRG